VKIYLDTHCLVWIFYGEQQKLSPRARHEIEENDLVASPMSVLELELMHEIGRMRQSATTIVSALETDINLRICDLSFRDVASHAAKENWTRDPFDRLIVANAKTAGAPLISKDERMRAHYSGAIW
jgi:PIN domain nuclease of toxin-antitoxin system